jgi:hypothetical protein
MVEHDGRIEILARELALVRQRYKTALTAFLDEEGE